MKTILFFLSVFFIKTIIIAQCSGNEPVIDLGNDTILCPGQSLVLQVPSGYNSYLWSTTSTFQSITVSNPGTYYVSGTITSGGTNLVVNGDFENGSTGFISDYIPGTGGSWGLLSNPGQFAVSTSPNLVHNNFYSCGDHTTGTGQMYIANGSDIANTVVWSQTIPVVPNTNYNFSTWASSVENTGNPAILQFFVNNVQIGSVFSPSATGCSWSQFYDLWNSGSATSAIISIKNQNLDGGGNDFALDDIQFTSFCTNTDTIVVNFDTTAISAGPDLTYCDYAPMELTATSNDPGLVFSWNTGESTTTISPDTSGIYILSATTANDCVITDQVSVTINTAPIAAMTATPQTGIVPLSVNITNTSQNATNFDWDFGNGVTMNTTDLSDVSIEYPDAGVFVISLIASNANCVDTITLTEIVTNPVSLEAANVFTPNNDGNNDVYKFQMVNIKELDLKIINRWGNEMYTTTDVNGFWDGKDSSGKEATDGIYFYTYKATAVQGQSFEGQGFIHLIR